MSNTNTVPSAEAVLERFGCTFVKGSTPEHFIKAMHEHTRLHLEAMRDEIADNTETTFDSANNVIVDRDKIIEIANTYIKTNKL